MGKPFENPYEGSWFQQWPREKKGVMIALAFSILLTPVPFLFYVFPHPGFLIPMFGWAILTFLLFIGIATTLADNLYLYSLYCSLLFLYGLVGVYACFTVVRYMPYQIF